MALKSLVKVMQDLYHQPYLMYASRDDDIMFFGSLY